MKGSACGNKVMLVTIKMLCGPWMASTLNATCFDKLDLSLGRWNTSFAAEWSKQRHCRVWRRLFGPFGETICRLEGGIQQLHHNCCRGFHEQDESFVDTVMVLWRSLEQWTGGSTPLSIGCVRCIQFLLECGDRVRWLRRGGWVLIRWARRRDRCWIRLLGVLLRRRLWGSMMGGDEGCVPNGRGYSTISMDQSALFSSGDDVSDVDGDAKDAGALFVLESKGMRFSPKCFPSFLRVWVVQCKNSRPFFLPRICACFL